MHFDPPDIKRLNALCGSFHQNLKQIEQRLAVQIHHRGHHFHVHGSLTAVTHAERLLRTLYEETLTNSDISSEMVHLMLQTCQSVVLDDVDSTQESAFPALFTRKGSIRPRGDNQARYVANILRHDISFGVGPAGTGKTYLAVAAAVDQLEKDAIRRILLVRPAVEAGEKLGFLPGDLSDKIDPYLRPLYDALYEMLGFERVTKLIEKQVIEVAPLAYMRGRTLNNAFIILDEGQNTTREQMKMFLTRLGFGSVY